MPEGTNKGGFVQVRGHLGQFDMTCQFGSIHMREKFVNQTQGLVTVFLSTNYSNYTVLDSFACVVARTRDRFVCGTAADLV